MRLANLSSQYKADTNLVSLIVSIVLNNKGIADEPCSYTLNVRESHGTYSDIYLIIKDNNSKMQVSYVSESLKI